MTIIHKLQTILLEKPFSEHFVVLHFSERLLLPIIWVDDFVAPRRSGLHLGNVEYDNTLAVLSAPGRRNDEEAYERLCNC